MCRWVLYQGTPIALDLLLTKPVHSIIHQSFRSELREEPLNGDGFGVAWYARQFSDAPARMRSTQPAWNHENLESVARVTQSPLVMTHVRAATPGLSVQQTNCHPFTAGRYAFMHNGNVPEFARIKRAVQARLSDAAFSNIHGSTDSEHLFALFLDAMKEQSHESPMRAMTQSVLRTIEVIMELVDTDEPTYLNLAVSDGERSVVSRYVSGDGEPQSLFVHEGRRYVLEDGVCRMVDADLEQTTVIVASEPLSADPGWDVVPKNQGLSIDPDGGLQRFSI